MIEFMGVLLKLPTATATAFRSRGCGVRDHFLAQFGRIHLAGYCTALR